MHYLIGDVQGCRDALERLLAEIGFSPSRDHLLVVGCSLPDVFTWLEAHVRR